VRVAPLPPALGQVTQVLFEFHDRMVAGEEEKAAVHSEAAGAGVHGGAPDGALQGGHLRQAISVRYARGGSSGGCR